MTSLVWIGDWELACCGVPFAVGDEVEWRLTDGGDGAFFADLFPADAAVRPILYDAHDAGPAPTACRARVVAVDAVAWRYAQAADGTWVPVAGSASRTALGRWPGAPDEAPEAVDPSSGEPTLAGYLVEVDLLVGTPGPPH